MPPLHRNESPDLLEEAGRRRCPACDPLQHFRKDPGATVIHIHPVDGKHHHCHVRAGGPDDLAQTLIAGHIDLVKGILQLGLVRVRQFIFDIRRVPQAMAGMMQCEIVGQEEVPRFLLHQGDAHLTEFFVDLEHGRAVPNKVALAYQAVHLIPKQTGAEILADPSGKLRWITLKGNEQIVCGPADYFQAIERFGRIDVRSIQHNGTRTAGLEGAPERLIRQPVLSRRTELHGLFFPHSVTMQGCYGGV